MVEDPRDDGAVEGDDRFACQLCEGTFDSQQDLEEYGQREHEGGGDHTPKA